MRGASEVMKLKLEFNKKNHCFLVSFLKIKFWVISNFCIFLKVQSELGTEEHFPFSQYMYNDCVFPRKF